MNTLNETTSSSVAKIKKRNDLINATYRLGLFETRLFLKMASYINDDTEEFTEYRMAVKDFLEEIGSKSKRAYEVISKACDNLMHTIVNIPSKDGGFTKIALFNVAKYRPGEGYVSLTFHNKLKPYFLMLKDNYTPYKLSIALSLNSSYHIRLYELTKQYEKIGKRKFDIEEIRLKLGLEDKYDTASKIGMLLDRAVNEINEKCDIKLSYVPVKNSRKIVAYEFKIHTVVVSIDEVKEQENIFTQYKEKEDNSKIARIKESIDEKIMDRIIKRYGKEMVVANMEYADANFDGNKGSYEKYLLLCIEHDWAQFKAKRAKEERLKTAAFEKRTIVQRKLEKGEYITENEKILLSEEQQDMLEIDVEYYQKIGDWRYCLKQSKQIELELI